MRGMILKDFYLLKEMKRLVGLFVVIAVAMLAAGDGENFMLGYINVMAVSIGLNTFAYDDANNGRGFLMTLPVTRRDYVREKYVFAFLCSGAGWIFTVIATTISLFVKGKIDVGGWAVIYGVYLLIILLTITVTQPVLIKYGTEKGRTAMIALWFGIFAIVMLGAKLIQKGGGNPAEILAPVLRIGTAPLIGIAFGVILVLLCISYKLSVRFMEEKEF